MIVNIDKGRASFASASDCPAAVHVRVEPGMSRTFPTPAHAADLEHPYYFTAGAAVGTEGNEGEDTRWTTPLKASSIDTL
jgi:hypothetical protein